MLTLFRGDDLAFAEYDRKVCVRFNTCQDLTGWAAKFSILDNVKQTTDISSRLWTFGYTSKETQLFPLGKTFGKLVIFDSTGRVRQMSKVEVEVTNQKLEPCIDGLIAISVDNVIADYNNMGNKPVLNGKVIEGSHDSDYYGLASKEDVELYKGLSDTVEMMSATVADQGEAIANNYLKLLGLAAKVDELAPGIDYSAQIAELSSRINTETANRTAADTALSEKVTAVETKVGELEEADAIEATARKEADDALGAMVDKVEADMASALEEEKRERDAAIVSLIDGATPVTKLLFEAEDDTENFYRIQVVMRDDGTGHLVPALALDTISKEDSTSGDESDSVI